MLLQRPQTMYHLQLIPLNKKQSHFFVFNHHSIDPNFRNPSQSTIINNPETTTRTGAANAMPWQT
jgi:hypothetical protein